MRVNESEKREGTRREERREEEKVALVGNHLQTSAVTFALDNTVKLCHMPHASGVGMSIGRRVCVFQGLIVSSSLFTIHSSLYFCFRSWPATKPNPFAKEFIKQTRLKYTITLKYTFRYPQTSKGYEKNMYIYNLMKQN